MLPVSPKSLARPFLNQETFRLNALQSPVKDDKASFGSSQPLSQCFPESPVYPTAPPGSAVSVKSEKAASITGSLSSPSNQRKVSPSSSLYSPDAMQSSQGLVLHPSTSGKTLPQVNSYSNLSGGHMFRIWHKANRPLRQA